MFIFLLCLQFNAVQAAGREPFGANDSIAIWIQPFVEKAYNDLSQLEKEHLDLTEPLRMRLSDVNHTLSDPRNRNPESGFQLLWEKIQLEATLKSMVQDHELKLLKLRYRKSIEIVKMLYEKVLSMDHHLSSLKAQQGLSNLSNPNTYPEFKDARTMACPLPPIPACSPAQRPTYSSRLIVWALLSKNTAIS